MAKTEAKTPALPAELIGALTGFAALRGLDGGHDAWLAEASDEDLIFTPSAGAGS